MSNLCKLFPDDTILAALNKMSEAGANGSLIPSLAFVEEDGKLIGSISDGDIRKLIGAKKSQHPLSKKVFEVMNRDPVTINVSDLDQIEEVVHRIQRNVSGIFVVDDHGAYLDVIEVDRIIESGTKFFSDVNRINVVVVGLGFVGLTLALHSAKHGFSTFGIDENLNYIKSINRCEIPFYERGLDELLNELKDKNFFAIETMCDLKKEIVENKSNVFILAVGTPIKAGEACVSQLMSACKTVASIMRRGDLILLRSTVKAGTSSNLLVPYIEELTNWRCGVDFFFAMAPERTVEGSALLELETLPQLVGANDAQSHQVSNDFLKQICPQVIDVNSTTEAEFSKLLCNSFRDLTFGFSNEFATTIENIGIDAAGLIEKCNFGYPRGGIPLPSPGVGGYCLTKDPLLYAATLRDISSSKVGTLSELARHKNELSTLAPLRAINKFSKQNKLQLEELRVLVVGVAFKGVPATDDARFSTSIDLIHELKEKVKDIFWADYALSENQIISLSKYNRIATNEPIPAHLDVVIVMNNHIDNTRLKLGVWLEDDGNKLFFDGWGQFKYLRERGSYKNITYSNMGDLG